MPDVLCIVGGRDNCVQIQVRLVDRNGNVVTNRVVPLKLSLLYGNMTRVHNQDILKTSPDSRYRVHKARFTQLY